MLFYDLWQNEEGNSDSEEEWPTEDLDWNDSSSELEEEQEQVGHKRLVSVRNNQTRSETRIRALESHSVCKMFLAPAGVFRLSLIICSSIPKKKCDSVDSL